MRRWTKSAIAFSFATVLGVGGSVYAQDEQEELIEEEVLEEEEALEEEALEGEQAAEGKQRRDLSAMDTAEIEEMQQLLEDEGHYKAGVDGIVGKYTKRAIEDFQIENDLDATGQMDEDTAYQLGLGETSGTY
jgi:hypothetical protein